ncbi:hypothetical protein E6H15_06965 [Candidatus Bathyarchaeota archaeon]|nr:MAG: hypothetical protein E6H22_05495 [Candidatus Bathyarchaeota archaeon]TMI54048.1 MAG: hypothetical protein E6H15_06965 [Candidatus Bathyarchaeota archaeon]
MFACENGPGCWSTDVAVTKEKLAIVLSVSEDCVCQDCLSSRSNNL